MIARALLGMWLVACGHASDAPAPSARLNCGFSTTDWCPVDGDPCSANHDGSACKADPRCEALRYRGESAVACITDDRCFASNCPAIGCITRCEQLSHDDCERDEPCLWRGQYGACAAGEHRCHWDGNACARATSCVGGRPLSPPPQR
jgi:hypothetical protein